MQAETRLAYQDIGRGPTVVFLHDFLLTPDCWQQQVDPLLAAGFRIVLPDLASCPGNGRLSGYSTGLIDLLDRLGLGRVVVCGMGMGGAILFDLLERVPQRIAGACFIATRPVADDIQEKARRGELVADLLLQDGWSVREELLKRLVAGREKQLSDSDMQAVQQMVHDFDGQDLINSLKAMAKRKDYTRLLKTLQLPTLVIGGEHDHICHPAHTRIMAGQLPNCYRAVNLDAGHLMQLEQPEAFNRQLLDFLRVIVPRRQRAAGQRPKQAA